MEDNVTCHNIFNNNEKKNILMQTFARNNNERKKNEWNRATRSEQQRK